MFCRTRKDIEIHSELSTEPVIVEGDQRLLEQVLLNLYINAWQAMPGSGTLTLLTSITIIDESTSKLYQIAPGNYAVITIADTGIGMDKDTRLRVFEPFFTTKDKGRGTGLGLASSYGIINNHQGIIHVRSTPGSGSTFDILLPLSELKLTADLEEMPDIQQGSGVILLVDDAQMILDVGQAMLASRHLGD